jgi:hypothetical protein
MLSELQNGARHCAVSGAHLLRKTVTGVVPLTLPY